MDFLKDPVGWDKAKQKGITVWNEKCQQGQIQQAIKSFVVRQSLHFVPRQIADQ